MPTLLESVLNKCSDMGTHSGLWMRKSRIRFSVGRISDMNVSEFVQAWVFWLPWSECCCSGPHSTGTHVVIDWNVIIWPYDCGQAVITKFYMVVTITCKEIHCHLEKGLSLKMQLTCKLLPRSDRLPKTLETKLLLALDLMSFWVKRVFRLRR